MICSFTPLKGLQNHCEHETARQQRTQHNPTTAQSDNQFQEIFSSHLSSEYFGHLAAIVSTSTICRRNTNFVIVLTTRPAYA